MDGGRDGWEGGMGGREEGNGREGGRGEVMICHDE